MNELMGLKPFFRELKKRNIYRVSVVYGITGWVIVQIASIAAEAFGAPSWVMKMVITAILLGFPITLIMAWAFEVTPDGVRRTEAAADSTSGDRYFWAGTALVTVLLFGAWWFMVGDGTRRSQRGADQQAIDRSIAVLPFNSVSSSGNTLPLAEGLHDDLLTRLANISDLKVISRTSVERFQGSNLTLPAIADSLGVRWIMEGGVQQMQDKIRINAQLIDPQTDTHIWADTYERDLTAKDMFAIQGEMAREIADALQAELSAGEQERIAGAPTENIEAYRLYVKGRRLLDRREEESIREAKVYFKQALEQDSTFAQAWAGMADARSLEPAYIRETDVNSFSEKFKAALPQAKAAAQRALELDPNLADAHASLGLIYYFEQITNQTTQNGPAGLEALQRAVDLKPSYAQAHGWLGRWMLDLGRPESALRHYTLAAELNPKNNPARRGVTSALIANGMYEEALIEAHQFQELYPKREVGMALKSAVFVHLKQWSNVREVIRPYFFKTAEPSLWALTYLALADLSVGDTVSTRSRLDQLRQRAGANFGIALIEAGLDNDEAALSALFKEKRHYYEGLYILPRSGVQELRYFYPDILHSIRKSSQYNQLIRRLNEWLGLNPDGSLPE